MWFAKIYFLEEKNNRERSSEDIEFYEYIFQKFISINRM